MLTLDGLATPPPNLGGDGGLNLKIRAGGAALAVTFAELLEFTGTLNAADKSAIITDQKGYRTVP